MIRILFLDASALLSFFVSDKGTPAMRWLISSHNKAHNATRYVINNRVIREFEISLQKLVSKAEIKQSTADNILALFNAHYKNRKFKVVGKEASVKETMDGMYIFIGRLTRPVLVTCNTETSIECAEYKVINPQQHDPSTIKLLLQREQKSSTESADNSGIFQRFFRKNRITLAS